MNNLLKFLLTFALMLCFIFSVMLIIGCEENATTGKKECLQGQIYNSIIGNCVYRHCQRDVYYSEEDAKLIGYQGCFQGCFIELNNYMKCFYALTNEEINDLKQLD